MLSLLFNIEARPSNLSYYLVSGDELYVSMCIKLKLILNSRDKFVHNVLIF